MLADRDTLHVKEGFWKGLDADNVADIFAPEEEREAQADLLVDYTRLFGEGFVRAEQDLRPFLPSWATDFVGELPAATDTVGPPVSSYSEVSSERDSVLATSYPWLVERPSFPPRDVRSLRQALFPVTHTAPDVPAAQLSAEDPGAPLTRWCWFWARKLDKADSYQQQKIIQSLFLQSASRLHHLPASIPSVASVAAT